MLFGNRRPGTLAARRHDHELFRPRCERLESKVLLAIDLGGTIPPISPISATAPYGMDFGGATPAQGAGFSVADIGDVNGSGYDSFLIGAPTVSSTPNTIGSGGGSAVYLVLGSQTVDVNTATDWIAKNSSGAFNYTPNDRVGDLGQITGSTPADQTNPITGGTLDFPFAGIKFETNPLIDPTPMLGASVAGVRMGSGQGGILIGAPGGLNSNNTDPGTGRVYLIYESANGDFNNYVGDSINIDDPNFATDYPGLNLVTFESAGTGGQLGYSVGGGSNLFGDGQNDIIMGAPSATVAPSTSTSPVNSNTGVVYALSLSALPSGTGLVNVANIGQAGSTSVQLAGINSGDRAGFSVADGGDVNGVTVGGTNVDDFLIGAPSAGSGVGSAYLIYGGSNLAGLATTTNGVRYINLSLVGSTGTGAVPGATFTGPAGGDLTGYAVSTAGEFNDSGFAGILIGSPGFSSSSTATSQGEVSLFYGAASGSTSYLTGTIPLSNIPTGVQSVTLTGANAGDMAGYALSVVGFINVGQPNLILIGAPGFNSDAGTAYLIPGRAGFTGTFSLANIQSSPISGLQFLLSTPGSPAGTPNFFGASVSSRFQDTNFTADGDSFADFIIGAPGYDITQNSSRLLAGGAEIVQGGLISVPIPAALTVTTQIGVGTPFAPFNISGTTPSNLPIYVFGSTTTTPNFMPVTDINPATVTVNGVAFPTATIQQDTDTGNYLNGIPDAIITISPRSALNLPNGVDVITIKGQTLSTSPLPNYTWTGTATVSVSGGTTTPVTLAVGPPSGPSQTVTFVPPFGSTQYTPSITELSAFNYQPIPLQVALQQYLPPQGFRQRIYSFNHPGKVSGPYLTNRGQNTGRASGVSTLSAKVYDRSRFHPQKNYSWTVKFPRSAVVNGIIPTQSKHGTFDDNLLDDAASTPRPARIQGSKP
jgi:hypothetical protein